MISGVLLHLPIRISDKVHALACCRVWRLISRCGRVVFLCFSRATYPSASGQIRTQIQTLSMLGKPLYHEGCHEVPGNGKDGKVCTFRYSRLLPVYDCKYKIQKVTSLLRTYSTSCQRRFVSILALLCPPWRLIYTRLCNCQWNCFNHYAVTFGGRK